MLKTKQSDRIILHLNNRNMNKIFNMLYWILFFVLNVHGDQSTIRFTGNGPVEGAIKKSVFGQKYHSFRGIPYAEPPITGIDPYTGQRVDRRFKVQNEILN